MSIAIAILLTASSIMEAGDLTRVELNGRAKAFATHTAGADEFWIGYAIDGDLETHWVGEGHPLTEHPTSIVIEFQEPTTVARLVLVSEIFRDRLALKDFDVFAWADTNWAGAQPLARIRGTRDERTVVDFAPVTTTRLRIRILDNWREDHTYPRLREMEVYSPPATTPGRKLTDAPVPDEKTSERVLVRRAQTATATSRWPRRILAGFSNCRILPAAASSW
jgi:hypothetical protein